MGASSTYTPTTLLKKPKVRVVGVMLIGLFAVNGVAAFASLYALGRPYVTVGSVVAAFIYFWAIWTLPAGLPAASFGTFLAIRLMERQPAERSLWFWAWRGVASGTLLGASGTALWWGLMFMTVPDHLRKVIGPVTAIGAGAGAGVGLIVALYCWRIRPIRTSA